MTKISILKVQTLLNMQMQQQASSSSKARRNRTGSPQAKGHSLLQQLSPHANKHTCPAKARHPPTQQLP